MKLSTLLEYQRCYDTMRELDCSPSGLNSAQYIDVLKAKTLFDAELAEHIKPINVEITT